MSHAASSFRKLAICLWIAAVPVGPALAHGGGLDVCGGHHDRKNGGYHVHNQTLHRNCHPESAPARSETASTPVGKPRIEVWVGAGGKKYHRGTCRHLTATRRALGLAEAKARYTACDVCRPDETPTAWTPRPAKPPVISPPTLANRCAATTRGGMRCSRSAGRDSRYCSQHAK